MTRTIPTCGRCYSDLEPELMDFWCATCERLVPFTEAVFLEPEDIDDEY
jgi:hypothetical protein